MKSCVLLPLSLSCLKRFTLVATKNGGGPCHSSGFPDLQIFSAIFCEELQPCCVDFVNLSSYSTQEKLT